MRNFLKEENGSALIIVSLALVVLLGITGLVIDGGLLYVTKSHLQKTANGAVLSGAQELVNDEASVSSVANEILKAHNEENSLENMTIEQNQRLDIHLRKDVPLSFARIFGLNDVPVSVKAAAQLTKITAAKGAVPLGIDQSIPLEFYKEYKLKYDQTESDTGYFGVLALSGPGAKLYEENLRYGYDGEVKIGDIIETQTGNIAGKTRLAVNERINACPYPPIDLNHRDCPRILLVPVYKPYNHIVNQLMEVEIVGFAYFYLLEPLSSQDTSITGMFIKRVGTGYGDAAANDFGAYSAKLVK